MFRQRHCQTHLAGDLRAFAQEEEQQVHHDAEADHELEGALPKVERLAGQHLAALGCPFGDLVAQPVEIAHAHAVQPPLGKSRKHVLAALDIAGNIQLPMLDALVQGGALLHQQRAGDDHRKDRHQQAHQQGGCRGQVAPTAKTQQQVALQRSEQDAEYHRPEDGTVIRQQDPDEGDGHQRQQYCQGFVLQGGLVHRGSSHGLCVISAPRLGKSAVIPLMQVNTRRVCQP